MHHTFDLAALKAKNLPRCTFDTLGVRVTAAEGATPEGYAAELAELRTAVDAQVHAFIPPQKECIGCGATIACADIMGAFLATFTYGLAHGEGYCSRCGYPARANHYAPEDGSGLNFVRVLQYHPDELHERQPEVAVSP